MYNEASDEANKFYSQIEMMKHIFSLKCLEKKALILLLHIYLDKNDFFIFQQIFNKCCSSEDLEYAKVTSFRYTFPI